MLPAVVFEHQIAIARLFQPALDFLWKLRLGIHVIQYGALLADERFELGLPALDQKADFNKITLRFGLHE